MLIISEFSLNKNLSPQTTCKMFGDIIGTIIRNYKKVLTRRYYELSEKNSWSKDSSCLWFIWNVFCVDPLLLFPPSRLLADRGKELVRQIRLYADSLKRGGADILTWILVILANYLPRGISAHRLPAWFLPGEILYLSAFDLITSPPGRSSVEPGLLTEDVCVGRGPSSDLSLCNGHIFWNSGKNRLCMCGPGN